MANLCLVAWRAKVTLTLAEEIISLRNRGHRTLPCWGTPIQRCCSTYPKGGVFGDFVIVERGTVSSWLLDSNRCTRLLRLQSRPRHVSCSHIAFSVCGLLESTSLLGSSESPLSSAPWHFLQLGKAPLCSRLLAECLSPRYSQLTEK
jgi:hypothetical protein